MIIGLVGQKQSGKDTTASLIQNLLPSYEFENRKFAAKLKEICSIITGEPIECWEDEEFKNSIVYENTKQQNLTGRELLQFVGTDLFRNQLNIGIWSAALLHEYINAEKTPNWIITDCRFEDEVTNISTIEKQARIIKIVRPLVGKNYNITLEHKTFSDCTIQGVEKDTLYIGTQEEGHFYIPIDDIRLMHERLGLMHISEYAVETCSYHYLLINTTLHALEEQLITLLNKILNIS